jgi:hypothetical protein
MALVAHRSFCSLSDSVQPLIRRQPRVVGRVTARRPFTAPQSGVPQVRRDPGGNVRSSSRSGLDRVEPLRLIRTGPWFVTCFAWPQAGRKNIASATDASHSGRLRRIPSIPKVHPYPEGSFESQACEMSGRPAASGRCVNSLDWHFAIFALNHGRLRRMSAQRRHRMPLQSRSCERVTNRPISTYYSSRPDLDA